MTNSKDRRSLYVRSALVALVLAAFTIVEYFVAIELGSAIFLMLIALFKAIIVIQAYMHVSRLWNPEGEH
jgi:uncharacterized membrane protein